jgi:hypothetical protein
MEAKSNYDIQAAYLANAIDIAINAFNSHPTDDWNKAHIDHFIKVYSEWQYDALNPKSEYKKIQSLKYLINDVFTYFQEGEGNTVSYFWEEIKKSQLPYKRVNKMDKILKANKIKNQIEYDYIIDVIVPYQQEGLLDEQQVIFLNKLIGEFEMRNT